VGLKSSGLRAWGTERRPEGDVLKKSPPWRGGGGFLQYKRQKNKDKS
jgi:hypothetical protein